MAQEHEIRREPAIPEQVWEAVATAPGNFRWLYPMEIEPREGGTVSRGPSTVMVWDAQQRFACRYANDEGFSTALEYVIDARDSGSSVLQTVIRWLNRGTAEKHWEYKTDDAEKHTSFYHLTLEQYLRHFNGRPATYVQAQGPPVSAEADAFTMLR